MRQTHQINQLDKTNKANKSHHTTLGIIATLVPSTIIGIGIYSGISIANTNTTNALSYSTNEDISFTFAPTLSIGLSTNNLTIDNLVPGTTNDSNTVTVTVSSNTPYGYVLSAGVGSNDTTSPYYNTSSLTHENSTISNVFSSVDTNAGLPSLDTDNTWGYSTSTDNGTTWSTYSGLSHTTTKPLLDISDPATPSTIDFKIAARSASTQASGTYNNVITFYAVGKPEPLALYEEVAKMSKGTQSATDLQAEITSPTSRDYREDTSNSGVYEYNSTLFGESSDASNANKIYYYRGILEPEEDQGQYGSDGQATTYPNYVKLDNDTCWRIVRTTGSGGVKMIYNGDWIGSTCANSSYDTLINTSVFNGTRSTMQQTVRIGYTYNNDYASNNKKSLSSSGLFGSNSYDNNTTNSDIKNMIEDWYSDTISNYTNILETSAGYCGDRSVYKNSVLQSQSSLLDQYGGPALQFGFWGNSMNATLTCAMHQDGVVVNRSKVDLYSVAGDTTGNEKLSSPVALVTVDEASFSGARFNGASLEKIFLNSDSPFWLLSPSHTNINGVTNIIIVSSGCISTETVSGKKGVRPVISLKPGTTVVGGSGIATDPWVVTAQ